MTDPNVYPQGLDAERVKNIIEYYDAQTDDEALAELKAHWAIEDATTTMLRVPNDMVSAVRALLQAYQRAMWIAEIEVAPEFPDVPHVTVSPAPAEPRAKRTARRTTLQKTGAL